MPLLLVATNRYYIICFHLLLSFLVCLFYCNYKKLSTFNYNLYRRLLSLIILVTISVTIYDHFLNDLILSHTIWDAITIWNHVLTQFDLCHTCTIPKDIVGQYNSDDTNMYCCTKDLDKLVRLIMLLWTILQFIFIYTTSGREKKLTLGRSCEFASRKYPGDYNQFYELCVELEYKYFPIKSLENFVVSLGHPVEKSDIESFLIYFREDELDHRLNDKRFIENNNTAKKNYDDKMAENKLSYERCKKADVIERRRCDTWTYEDYLKQKEDVTLHTQSPVIIITTTNQSKINNTNDSDGDSNNKNKSNIDDDNSNSDNKDKNNRNNNTI